MNARTTVGPAVALAAALLAACTSSGGSTGGTSAAPVSASPPAATTQPASTVTASHTVTASRTVSASPRTSSSAAASSTPASSSVPPAPSHCTNSDLRITASEGDGASQHNRYVLRFRNVSSSTCTLHGYPGVDAIRSNGAVLAHAKRTPAGFMGGSRHGVPTVRLAAGDTASAVVEWMTFSAKYPAGNCPGGQLAVTAANTTRAVTIHQTVNECSLQIHPTVPGSTGNDN